MHRKNVRRLQSLAQAAICHALEQHNVGLDHQRLELVDQVLDFERNRENAEDQQALSLCYGAWLGEWAVAKLRGHWVGLSEPTPPRIVVGGVPTSPMDAVRRRLTDDHSPAMQALVAQWIEWSELTKNDALIRSQNQAAWDARDTDERFVRTVALPSDREEAIASLDPWLLENGVLEGRRILCLAAGGGTHGPLFSLAGADVTVVDFSERQLEIDRTLAANHGLQVKTVKASIDDLSVLETSSFDIVIQPVSTSYVREVTRIYDEVARVLSSGGLYVSQHKQPTSLQSTASTTTDGYLIRIPADKGYAIPPSAEVTTVREHEMTEYVHGWDALIGGLCRSGFVIEDLQEPPRADAWAKVGTPEHRARYLPPYVKIKARRTGL